MNEMKLKKKQSKKNDSFPFQVSVYNLTKKEEQKQISNES